MIWKCGIVQGIGFCAFIVENEHPDHLMVRNVTIPQPVQDERGRSGVAWGPWWPEHLGYALTPVRVLRDHIFAISDAGEKAVVHCEEAWGLRKIATPVRPNLVVPGRNGQQ